MKTLKSLKVTSIIQGIFCVYYLLCFAFVVIGNTIGPISLANIVLFLFFYFTYYSIIVAPICFAVNLSYFLKDRKDPEQRKFIGKKWVWIFVWPIILLAFFFIACLPFIRVPFFS